MTAAFAPFISLPGMVGSPENGFWPLTPTSEMRKPEEPEKASLLQTQIHNLHP